MSDRMRWIAVLIVAVAAYFVAFPEDADAVARPIGSILGLTSAISPWLYGLIAVAIVAKVVAKCCASRAAT